MNHVHKSSSSLPSINHMKMISYFWKHPIKLRIALRASETFLRPYFDLRSKGGTLGNKKPRNPKYEAYKRKTGMTLIALQPLVPDKVYMPPMEAMYVPFHMGYSSLICYKGLQSERPKCLRELAEVSQTSLCKTVRRTIQI